MTTNKANNDLLSLIYEQASAPFTKMLLLAAIWPKTPVKTSIGRQFRITAGDRVTIEDGQLIDCNGTPTHEIKQCHGTIMNTCFSITVRNIITNELSVVNL